MAHIHPSVSQAAPRTNPHGSWGLGVMRHAARKGRMPSWRDVTRQLSARQDLRPTAHRHVVLSGWLASLALLSTGSAIAQVLDPQFAPSFDDSVSTIVRQANGTLIVGGSFSSVSGQSRYALAKLSADGQLLAAFPSIPNNQVRSIALDAGGRMVIGGDFDQIGTFHSHMVARLKTDGSVDSSFVSGLMPNIGQVDAVAVLSNGKIAVTGSLLTASGPTRIALLNADGSVDSGFNPPVLDHIDSMLVSDNDRLLIAGSFDEQDPDCIFDCVIALSLDGSISASFSMTGVSVKHMSLQHDGKILVTGNFSKINDHTTYYVGRIMPNGGADGTFTNTDMRYASMKVIHQRANGNILVGGSWRWLGESASINRVAQLSSSGARDVSFDEPMFSSLIFALSVPSNFEFIVGGMFEIVNGTARNGLARFLMERPDPVFHNGFD